MTHDDLNIARESLNYFRVNAIIHGWTRNNLFIWSCQFKEPEKEVVQKLTSSIVGIPALQLYSLDHVFVMAALLLLSFRWLFVSYGNRLIDL